MGPARRRAARRRVGPADRPAALPRLCTGAEGERAIGQGRTQAVAGLERRDRRLPPAGGPTRAEPRGAGGPNPPPRAPPAGGVRPPRRGGPPPGPPALAPHPGPAPPPGPPTP